MMLMISITFVIMLQASLSLSCAGTALDPRTADPCAGGDQMITPYSSNRLDKSMKA